MSRVGRTGPAPRRRLGGGRLSLGAKVQGQIGTLENKLNLEAAP
jgi:hypothetical protein